MTISRNALSLLAILLTLAVVSPAAAQAEKAPTDAQLQLLDKGARAAAANEFDAASAAFAEALKEGPYNIIYLNLGRAHFMAGRCKEASEALGKVSSSPAVAVPSKADVDGALARFQNDLNTTCKGSVRFECSAEGTTVAVDGGEPAQCAGLALELAPGKHNIVATLGTAQLEHEVTVTPGGDETVALTLTQTEKAPAVVKVSASQPNTLAWATIGVGAAMLVGVGIYDLAVLRPDFDDYEAAAERGDAQTHADLKDSLSTGQTLEFVGLGIGSVALVGGVALLFMDESGATSESAGLSPWVSPSEAGVTWSGRF